MIRFFAAACLLCLSGFSAEAATCHNVYPDGTATYCLRITDVQFNCEKSLMGDGYQSCTADFTYTIATDYRGRGFPDVNVSCEANVEFSSQDSFLPTTDTGDDQTTTSVMYGSGSGSMSVEVSYSGIVEKATRAKLSEASCRITDVEVF